MTIRVLMVTDSDGSFTEAGERFGLTELVKALEQDNLCKVTKAHRYPAGWAHTGAADITHFQFTNAAHFNPDNYDEIWLMGFGSSNPDGPYGDPADYKMTSHEVEKLASFMNSGGGVFATGDHDDLGIDLCGAVPRVRSMRLWETDYSTLSPAAGKSPRPTGPNRLDTLQKGHDNFYEFQDQSDDIPQTIYPVMHTLRKQVSHLAGGVFGWAQNVPHPLLCGPEGVINVLPDHMHEGHCVVPENLGGSFTIGTLSYPEYPKNSHGVQIAPEEVAFGRTTARQKDPSFTDPDHTRDANTPVNPAEFADIVAYDGWRADIGRVVVGATFHHYVNVNISGTKPGFAAELPAENAINASGFLASPAGQQHYAHIKQYWRNIARWISRKHYWYDMAWDAIKGVAFDPELKQILPRGNFDKVSPDTVSSFGAQAFNLLRYQYATCTVISFFSDIAVVDPLSYLLAPWVYILHTLPDPAPIERLRQEMEHDKLEVVYFAYGAMMMELRKPEPYRAFLSGKLDAKRGMEIVHAAAQKGALLGLAVQAERMERSAEAIRKAIALATDRIQPAVAKAS